jgi:protein MpaA
MVGCFARRPVQTDPPPIAPLSLPAPSRDVLGASVNGTPIEIESFRRAGGGGGGDDDHGGRPVVLVLGGIHGDEVGSVDVSRGLADLLRGDPSLIPPNRTVAIIEVANPDGYAHRTRTNARGIDLNRNFPAKNFRPGGGRAFRGGAAPASEPETRALIAAIERLRPRLIVSVHSIRNGKQQNNYDGPGEEVAKRMAAHNGYPVTSTIGYPTPGSLGSYAGVDLGIPVITLELPREQTGDAAWADNRDALLAAIRW